MTRTGRPVSEIELADAEREQLVSWSRSAVSQQLAFRARIVLALAGDRSGRQVAAELGTTEMTVSKWRRRFQAGRLGGLRDSERTGRPEGKRGGCGTRGGGGGGGGTG